jgi:hypothetical protein
MHLDSSEKCKVKSDESRKLLDQQDKVHNGPWDILFNEN